MGLYHVSSSFIDLLLIVSMFLMEVTILEEKFGGIKSTEAGL
jgi:hypothetical protein